MHLVRQTAPVVVIPKVDVHIGGQVRRKRVTVQDDRPLALSRRQHQPVAILEPLSETAIPTRRRNLALQPLAVKRTETANPIRLVLKPLHIAIKPLDESRNGRNLLATDEEQLVRKPKENPPIFRIWGFGIGRSGGI